MSIVSVVFVRGRLLNRAAVAAENVALPQQLIVVRRSTKRARLQKRAFDARLMRAGPSTVPGRATPVYESSWPAVRAWTATLRFSFDPPSGFSRLVSDRR